MFSNPIISLARRGWLEFAWFKMRDSDHTIEFVQLLTSHQRRLHNYIAVFLPHLADTEDVLQETNAVLWAKADRFQAGTSFIAWARAIARLEIIEFCRRNKNRALVFDAELLESLTQELEEDPTEEFRYEALQKCIAKLPVGDRQLVASRYEQSMPVKDVADNLKRSAGSVYRSLERIRMTLLECINRTLAAEERHS